MKTPACSDAAGNHTARCLDTDHTGRDLIDLRKITVGEHGEFLASLLRPQDFDDLDDDRIIIDPYELHAPSRRSDKDLASFLDLIDGLPTGNDRKEITQ